MAFSLGVPPFTGRSGRLRSLPLSTPHTTSASLKMLKLRAGVKTSSLLSESQHNTGTAPTLVEMCVCKSAPCLSQETLQKLPRPPSLDSAIPTVTLCCTPTSVGLRGLEV